MSSHFEDGWQEDNSDDLYNHVNPANRFTAKDKPLGILESTKHSLEPDMLFGWRPKLPSCPLPLRFINVETSALLNKISQSDLYKIAYKNKHFVSSVEVNQRYDYNWKYRSRYSLNLALIEQAAKQQFQSNLSPTTLCPISLCEYTFGSQFQSGNLDFAIRIKPAEYDCFLRSDSNTRGHCNWYFFSVKNHQRIGEVKINVCNIGKTRNLYNKGMRPYVREGVEGQVLGNTGEGEWSQEPCYAVEFVERICRYGSDAKRFQLQFKFNFSKPNQEVFFAYGIPYTYSKLEKLIKEMSSEDNREILVVDKLCESLGGLNIPLLKITNNAQKQTQIQTTKKAILLSARIHPGESHSSYVMEGVIRELLKRDEEHEILREMFVFYIVPMINVDGVIVGNYRTSYSGKDLNRQFKNLDNFVFPEITRLHDLALQIRQKHFKGIEFYFDFHGHSSKKNLFAYGPDHSPRSIYFFKSRIFPKLIEEIHPIFSYKKSNFRISEGKKKTARAHMLWKLKIPMVYTFEVSNGMYETKDKQNVLLCEKILLEAGQAVMKGFFKYVRLQMRIPAKLLQKKTQKQNIKKRIIKSSKGIRDSSIGIKRRGSKLNDIANMQFLSQKLVIDHKKRIYSKMQEGRTIDNERKAEELEKEMNEETYENLEEFMHLIDEVKNTKFEEDIEGGSDSESEGDDLEKEEAESLYKNIKNNKLLKELKQAKKKPSNPRLSRPKKPLPTTDQPSANIFTQIKKQLKRYKNSQLQQLIKESKKLNHQMSYITLPSNSKTLVKSPSMKDFTHRMSKIGMRLYNIGVSGAKDNCQGEKVVKVPLVQKSFNLEI